MNLDTDLIPFTKLSSKWILNLNVKHKTVHYLGEDIGEGPDDLGNGNASLFLFIYFLERKSMSRERG